MKTKLTKSSSRPYLVSLASAWALYHRQMSRVPTFLILLVSGALMNLLIGFVRMIFRKGRRSTDTMRQFHRGSDKEKRDSVAVMEQKVETAREQQRAALKSK